MANKSKFKVLIIGTGAREHALGWKIFQSSRVSKIYFATGNAGTAKVGENISIPDSKPKELIAWAKKNNIALTVVGPENSLNTGIVDIFQKNKLTIFGPTKNAAKLESSKAWSSKFMQKYSIPKPESRVFTDSQTAKKFIKTNPWGKLVIKADGLTLGKGVILPKDTKEALEVIDRVMVNKLFGSAGDKVVIQERLTGFEVSTMIITDGSHYLLLPYSEDHKPVYDNDKGPNTGGMGVVAPHPLIDKKLSQRIENEIVAPTIAGLKKDKIHFKGVIYPGIMITREGPKVLEYNVRFGDPETEAVLPLLNNKLDFFEVLYSAARGKLTKTGIYPVLNQTCVVVALASGGYPLKYQTGKKIHGLSHKTKSRTIVFHAANKNDDQNNILTNGGRVLMIAGLGKNLQEARKTVYANLPNKIHFEDMHYRKDIGIRKRN